jgi:sarcosine oxidase
VAYVFEAMKLGAEIHGREEVLDWQPYGDGVRVITNRDVYEADSLVITAGAWNYRLVDVLQGLSVPERQVLAWLQPRRPEKFTVENFPVFNLLVDEGRYYGFPVYSIPGFKFGKYHHFEESGDPDRLDREPNALDEEMLREFAARYFPDGCEATMSLAACLFTNTSDGHFLIDSHPVYPQVSFAAGFSGHGFKFASVMGEIMADLAERGQTRHNIEFFRIERLAGQPRRPIAGAASPRLAERMLTSYSPLLRGGHLSLQPHSASRRAGPEPGRNYDSYRPRRAFDQTRANYEGYTSTLAEDDLGAIKPFW